MPSPSIPQRRANPIQLHLAPMEGVIDHHMRELLTALGGYDLCVTEFVRVSDRLLPERVFHRLCPELAHDGRTAAGTPVVVQLLGVDPQVLAENAARAAELGAPGIDLNFGCPSRFVNRKGGGAALLDYPRRVHDIVAAVRRALPAQLPLSAKMRLGMEDDELALENALAAESAGCARLTVHARTRADGYRAPARWERLAAIREVLSIELVANGDIDGVAAWRRCRAVSGCDAFMLARGAVARPDLARRIRDDEADHAMGWEEVAGLLRRLAGMMEADYSDRNRGTRIKQWLAMMRGYSAEATRCFERVRPLRLYSEMAPRLG
ncbi:tRNA dihydrouridine synthase [Endothiovibrio diazotrophicus]